MTIASVTEAVSSVVGRHMLSARFAMQSRKTSTSSDEHRTGKHLTETMNPSTTSGVPNKETRHPSSHRSRAVRCPASHRYANGHRQKQRRHAVERPERWCSMQQSPFASLKTGSVDASLKKRSIRHPGSCPERWQKPGRRTAWGSRNANQRTRLWSARRMAQLPTILQLWSAAIRDRTGVGPISATIVKKLRSLAIRQSLRVSRQERHWPTSRQERARATPQVEP